ncbi:hypothetical protein E2C01_054706 [Portunus trituberculatus]|uniref:Uncharacterized protein n=1 Tax=Portunus trituberculatus TaxID=210409 RepID=A0A5B7GKK5_PORTR|nr:hypothetical protein [Portunus trituberculatus]
MLYCHDHRNLAVTKSTPRTSEVLRRATGILPVSVEKTGTPAACVIVDAAVAGTISAPRHAAPSVP